ncbi:MAG: hypothetical protein OQJ96_02800 [Flavobacteriales bacterium]|nr:hypothetical protein [Flavobacteriales bacterium]MCW8913108.1 hypothetical protein [Flavobacteriales bacterium]MCW8937810.1 hypothetical protein [Flavobacteriales bacterium]MCW8939039.1 hypothetical protein [Flavobacteriales bacterium]MCW8969215.1 hypothetical protein [Flavobacteriales bacterium]
MNNKLFSIILYVLLGLSAVLSVLFFADIVSEGMLINWCYILLGIATLTAIVFPIMTMAQNPKNAKNALVGIIGLAVVFALGYVMAGDEEVFDASAKLLADKSTSQLSEAGLNAFYILGLGAIGVIIFSEVSKIFK